MAKLLMTYLMYTYDDGSVAVKPIQNTKNELDLSQCSNSIRQIVMVLYNICKSTTNSGIRKKVSESISVVASNENITNSSVHAKITRKLGLSMEKFKDIVEEYFAGKSTELESILRGACVARTKTADEAAINQILDIVTESIQ
nr:hypothetical protein [uncultured Anaerosporobacter sp.]